MKIIVLGMQPGELYSPRHPSFNETKVRNLFNYLYGKPTIRCKTNTDALEQMTLIDDMELEIIGAFKGRCVARTINLALRLGITTFSQDNFLFDSDQDACKEVEPAVRVYNSPPDTLGVLPHIQMGTMRAINSYKYSFDSNTGNGGTHIFEPFYEN